MRWLKSPTFLPVLHRELRENSHRAFNYYLRPLAAGIAMFLLWLCVHNVEKEMNAPSMGLFLFSLLHTFLLLLIVIIVPVMTADSIAAEKRNGTLGLLFLTPLTARGIMIGKGCAHAFRAFTLWLSVLPILVIPFLLGGIAWFDVATAITMQFCAILISLAAGMLASALFRKRNATFGAASCFAFAFNIALSICFTFTFTTVALANSGFRGNRTVFDQSIELLPFVLTGYPEFFNFTGRMRSSMGGWSAVLTTRPTYPHIWTQLLIASALIAFLLLFIVLIIGAWQINRSWRDKQSRVSLKWSNRFCTPLFLNRFKSQMRRLLDRNPIAWLQQYSWRARTTKWGLCLAFIIIETIAVSFLQNSYDLLDSMITLQVLLLFIISIMFLFVGVSSFHTEKQSGALELILITPLRVTQIIYGRVHGLWKQFLPAFLVVATCHVATVVLFVHPWRGLNSQSRDDIFEPGAMLLYFAIALGFLNLPVFATYFALRVRNMVVAGILTTITVYLAPVFGALIFTEVLSQITGVRAHGNMLFTAIGLFLGNILFAGLAVFLLHHSLSRRIYSF
ncbi:MAG: hypothetical protein JWO95_467 [Verrucomicrobiales bacterium]|nr:hypothetical protein [Verrucomicrobiales bacterium]